MTQSTTFQCLNFLVYTVWACLKGMTPYKTLKEESTNKNHYDDNYNSILVTHNIILHCVIFCNILRRTRDFKFCVPNTLEKNKPGLLATRKLNHSAVGRSGS